MLINCRVGLRDSGEGGGELKICSKRALRNRRRREPEDKSHCKQADRLAEVSMASVQGRGRVIVRTVSSTGQA